MKRLLLTLIIAAGATALIPSAASAAPVCTSVNKGGATPDRKLVVSAWRDWHGLSHREYAVLYIGRTSTRARQCTVYISTVEVNDVGAPVHWTAGAPRHCEDALRRNVSLRYWGIVESAHVELRAKTVACLYLDRRKVGSCVYSPALHYP